MGYEGRFARDIPSIDAWLGRIRSANEWHGGKGRCYVRRKALRSEANRVISSPASRAKTALADHAVSSRSGPCWRSVTPRDT